jgi:hypothetical protein
MESESEKVQGDEHCGKIDFAVAEVVIEIVSLTQFSGFFGTDGAHPKFVHGFFGRRPWAWKKR